MSLIITPVNGLADLERFHSVLARSFDADHADLPADPVEELAVDLAGLHADEQTLMWVGEVAGRAVAAGRMSLPVRDNTSTASGARRPLPYYLAVESEAPAPAGITPAPVTEDTPRDNFGYALTWWIPGRRGECPASAG